MPGAGYHDLCEKLDILAIRVLELMQQILQERESFDSLLKNGFVNIAKSRYLQGSNNISFLQVSQENMSSLRKVVREERSLDDVTFESFKVIDIDDLSKEMDLHNELRQRPLKNRLDDLTQKIEACSLGTEEPEKIERVSSNLKDPLNWFGVLVPQSLRTSQKNFKQAVTAATNIATLQSELHSVSEQYKFLLADKKGMLKQDTKNDDM